MAFLENFENHAFQDELPFAVNPKVEKIIEEMKNDPDHQALMQRLAEYEERIKYMEDHGI